MFCFVLRTSQKAKHLHSHYFDLKLPLNVFPFQPAYVKSDLLSIYIPTQKSYDRVLRQAVNYDNRHNKNSPSVDSLLPGFIEKFVDSPLVSFQMLASNKKVTFQRFNVPSFDFAILFARTNIIKRFQLISLFKKNPIETISLKGHLV